MKDIARFIGFVITSGILAWFFWRYPGIDVAASKFFYNEQQGFFLKNNPAVLFLYNLVPYLVGAVIVGCLIAFAVFAIQTRRLLTKENLRVLYLLLVLAVGPGLVVNALLKEHWDRARPSQVTEFGGQKEFSPAFVITNQCKTNCSFASGHASMGFFFLAFAFVLFEHRGKFLIFGTLFGLAIGLARMMQGGHFLSDVIFSGVSVYMVAYLLAKLMKVERD